MLRGLPHFLSVFSNPAVSSIAYVVLSTRCCLCFVLAMITATVAVVHTIEHALFPYKQLLVVVVAAVYKVVYEKCCFICTLFAALFTSVLRSLLHQSHQQHVSIMQMLVLLLLLLFILLPVLELCSPRHRCGRSGVCQSSTVCVCDDQKLANRNQKLKSC